MSLKYNYAYAENGIDQFKIFDISGESPFDIADIFRAKYAALGIRVQENFAELGSDATYYYIFKLHYVIHLVIRNYEDFPFGTTPEARFKLGSYSYISRYINTTDSEGNVTSTPVFTPPNFIVYPRITLPSSFCFVDPNQPSYLTHSLGLDQPEADPQAVSLIQADNFITKSQQGTSCPGFQINLTEGLLADMMVEYSYTMITQNTPDFPTYVSII